MEKDMRWEERQTYRQMKTEERQLYTQTDGPQTEVEYDRHGNSQRDKLKHVKMDRRTDR
jgi:hypothetical protein